MIVLILMAGMGTRTQDLEPNIPKPLLKIHETPMINWVLSNFSFKNTVKYVFVIQKVINQKFELEKYFKKFNITFEIKELDGPNEGAALSALAASMTYQEQELLIVNSDQFLTLDMNLFIDEARKSTCDGMILTMSAKGSKWSYVLLDNKNQVIEVAEKREISNIATVGAYWFKNGSNFSTCVQEMVLNNDRTNNEFYLAPTYNYLIKKSKKILNFHIDDYNEKFYGLGTSEDILSFINNPISLQLVKTLEFK
jgi:NDP-sugar pyrophosphorylase family protein